MVNIKAAYAGSVFFQNIMCISLVGIYWLLLEKVNTNTTAHIELCNLICVALMWCGFHSISVYFGCYITGKASKSSKIKCLLMFKCNILLLSWWTINQPKVDGGRSHNVMGKQCRIFTLCYYPPAGPVYNFLGAYESCVYVNLLAVFFFFNAPLPLWWIHMIGQITYVSLITGTW